MRKRLIAIRVVVLILWLLLLVLPVPVGQPVVPVLPLRLIHDALGLHARPETSVIATPLATSSTGDIDDARAVVAAFKKRRRLLLMDASEEGSTAEARLAAVVEVAPLRHVAADSALAHLAPYGGHVRCLDRLLNSSLFFFLLRLLAAFVLRSRQCCCQEKERELI